MALRAANPGFVASLRHGAVVTRLAAPRQVARWQRKNSSFAAVGIPGRGAPAMMRSTWQQPRRSFILGSASDKSGSQAPSPNATSLVEERQMGWSQEQMFQIVSDVDQYKEFLPWIVDSKVTSRMKNECHADLEIGFAAIRERYTSHVKMQAPSTITAVSHDSHLFKLLQNHWVIQPGPDVAAGPTCMVHCKVVFEFRNPVHQMLAGAAFDKLVRQMIQGFEQRCASQYGPSSLPTQDKLPDSAARIGK